MAQAKQALLIVCRKGSQVEAAVPSLREAGYDVHHAASPFKAVAMHAGQPFPAILIDAALLNSGDDSIFEVFRESAPDVYILAVVPPGQRDKAVAFLKVGIDGYAVEPLYVDEIVTLVDNALNRARAGDPEALREERLRSLGQFARGVAHAINNPLTTLSGWLQIMQSDVRPDDPRRETLQVMSQEADRVARVVRDLLAFAGHPSPSRAPVDVNRLLDRVIMSVEQDGNHRTVLFTRHFTPGLGRVLADEQQLAEACATIVRFCASRSGAGADVDVATYPVDDNVHIEIAHSGEPLEAGKIERLFDPFGDDGTLQGGGEDGLSGLELPVSYGIIRGLGGTLNVRADEARGSSFVISLPASTQPELH